MRKNLLEYGWTTPWKKPYYLNKQLRQNASTYELLFSAKGYDEMEAALEKADLKETFPSDFSRERICIYDNQGNQFLSVFYHIRNAFAHCRLNMVDVDGECVFILEDVQPKKNSNQLKVSARMILRKSTLIKWIDLIENGECEYKKSRAKNPLWNKGRTSIQGQALYVRSARQTARTMEVRAVLRHSVPNKGLVSPAGSVSASKCFAF